MPVISTSPSVAIRSSILSEHHLNSLNSPINVNCYLNHTDVTTVTACDVNPINPALAVPVILPERNRNISDHKDDHKTDHSSSSMETHWVSRRRGPSASSTFPAKLQQILANDEFAHIITWMPHGRSWRVLQPKLFSEIVAPKYFSHQSKFSSFMRQVNGWGFKRITRGPDRNSYYHDLFIRDNTDLAKSMKRRSSTSRQTTAGSQEGDADDSEPNFYEMSGMTSSSSHINSHNLLGSGGPGPAGINSINSHSHGGHDAVSSSRGGVEPDDYTNIPSYGNQHGNHAGQHPHSHSGGYDYDPPMNHHQHQGGAGQGGHAHAHPPPHGYPPQSHHGYYGHPSHRPHPSHHPSYPPPHGHGHGHSHGGYPQHAAPPPHQSNPYSSYGSSSGSGEPPSSYSPPGRHGNASGGDRGTPLPHQMNMYPPHLGGATATGGGGHPPIPDRHQPSSHHDSSYSSLYWGQSHGPPPTSPSPYGYNPNPHSQGHYSSYNPPSAHHHSHHNQYPPSHSDPYYSGGGGSGSGSGGQAPSNYPPSDQHDSRERERPSDREQISSLQRGGGERDGGRPSTGGNAADSALPAIGSVDLNLGSVPDFAPPDERERDRVSSSSRGEDNRLGEGRGETAVSSSSANATTTSDDNRAAYDPTHAFNDAPPPSSINPHYDMGPTTTVTGGNGGGSSGAPPDGNDPVDDYTTTHPGMNNHMVPPMPDFFDGDDIDDRDRSIKRSPDSP